MNKSEELAHQVICEAESRGVVEFCVCPGARNSALFYALIKAEHLKKHFWFEERSGAFFALGRARESKRPVAIVTTSGSAAGELLPATMEAYYNNAPLLLITADRPRRFRGSGAPQAAEQVGLLSHYAPYFQDVAEGELCSLHDWDKKQPAHLNVCFEDPKGAKGFQTDAKPEFLEIDQFFERTKNPFIVVGALQRDRHERVINFLLNKQVPVYLEGVSGLRENKSLRHLRITRTEKIWPHAHKAGHPIDGVLRIGGVPTFRLWRDLEDKIGQVNVCSVSDVPFAGLSDSKVSCDLSHASFECDPSSKTPISQSAETWLNSDGIYHQKLQQLFAEEPSAEASLIHQLSKRIPNNAHVYLGNSLPIREWDLAANNEDRGFHVTASRGVNGIDGQISTFLGLCRPGSENWAILGDLTTLYDMAGPWILQHLQNISATIVVVNNSGGQFFARLFSHKDFLHSHSLNFKPLADMWGLHYERWESIPNTISSHQARLIELVPNEEASARFWQKLETI